MLHAHIIGENDICLLENLVALKKTIMCLQRSTPSYVKLPKDYPSIKANGRTTLGNDLLNNIWCSVTFGSEDYSFKVSTGVAVCNPADTSSLPHAVCTALCLLRSGHDDPHTPMDSYNLWRRSAWQHRPQKGGSCLFGGTLDHIQATP